MLAYMKQDQRYEGEVVGSAGFALIVERGQAREVVHKFEAEDQAEFQRAWDSVSPLAGVQWQTDEGPLAGPLE